MLVTIKNDKFQIRSTQPSTNNIIKKRIIVYRIMYEDMLRTARQGQRAMAEPHPHEPADRCPSERRATVH